MNCPQCSSTATAQLARKTSLGYKVFRTSACKRKFNKRTCTVYNRLQFPTDIVVLVVLWRLRYKLSLRDLSEMFLVKGFELTLETVRDWEARFAPHVTEQLLSRRKGKVGRSWYTDETCVKVSGNWCYLYRAIDRDEIGTATWSTRCSWRSKICKRLRGSSPRPKKWLAVIGSE
jgi:transposase-like protein